MLEITAFTKGALLSAHLSSHGRVAIPRKGAKRHSPETAFWEITPVKSGRVIWAGNVEAKYPPGRAVEG